MYTVHTVHSAHVTQVRGNKLFLQTGWAADAKGISWVETFLGGNNKALSAICPLTQRKQNCFQTFIFSRRGRCCAEHWAAGMQKGFLGSKLFSDATKKLSPFFAQMMTTLKVLCFVKVFNNEASWSLSSLASALCIQTAVEHCIVSIMNV